VLGVRGTFVPGDAVSIIDPDGTEIARGLSRLSASDAARVARKKSETNEEEDLVVHRDDLVVLPVE
jgi:glutamate 5-kinase